MAVIFLKMFSRKCKAVCIILQAREFSRNSVLQNYSWSKFLAIQEMYVSCLSYSSRNFPGWQQDETFHHF